MIRRILWSIALLLALLLPVTACKPTVPAPSPAVDTPVVTAPPTPAPGPNAQTLVVGDSITWQVVMSGQFPSDMVSHTYMGWQAKDVQAKVTEMTNNGTLGKLRIALGTNDSNPTWNGGWTQADEVLWDKLLDTPHHSVQIVVVLPWLDENALATHRTEIDEARAWITAAAAQRANVTLVDWKDFIHPGVLQADGIHLEGVVPGETLPASQVAIDARVAALQAG